MFKVNYKVSVNTTNNLIPWIKYSVGFTKLITESEKNCTNTEKMFSLTTLGYSTVCHVSDVKTQIPSQLASKSNKNCQINESHSIIACSK